MMAGDASLLVSAIDNELLEVERLVALIQSEQDVLVSRHLDQISPILELKVQALQVLESATRHRVAVAEALGLNSTDSISDFFIVNPPALGQWQRLLLQAKLAEVLNRSNAQLVQCHEEANHHLMGMLSQQKNQEIAYSADGRLSHQSGLGRPFDRA